MNHDSRHPPTQQQQQPMIPSITLYCTGWCDRGRSPTPRRRLLATRVPILKKMGTYRAKNAKILSTRQTTFRSSCVLGGVMYVNQFISLTSRTRHGRIWGGGSLGSNPPIHVEMNRSL